MPDLDSVKAIADASSRRSRTVALMTAAFVSRTTALPRAPTAEEQQAWTALAPEGLPIPGSRLSAFGGVEHLTWDGAAWTAQLAVAPQAQVNTVSATASAARDAQGNTSLAQLATKGEAAGPQFVDGSRWLWKAAGTADGWVNVGGAGGVWKREVRGNTLLFDWKGLLSGADATTALQDAINDTPAGSTLSLRGMSYAITGPVSLKAGVTLDLTGATLTVPTTARRDGWLGVFTAIGIDGWRVIGGTIKGQVPDAADEAALPTGANGYVQRAFYVDNCKHATIEQVDADRFLMEAYRLHACVRVQVNHCKGTQRSGWLNAEKTQLAASRPVFMASSPTAEAAGALAGTNSTVPWMDRTRSLAASNSGCQFYACEASGGTHGFIGINVIRLQVGLCKAEDNSHRGIILSPTSDHCTITTSTVLNSGSTGIHLANFCRYNTISGNTVDTVTGFEGDGIKLYVGCDHNTVMGNTVRGVKHGGIRVAFGSSFNAVLGNAIYMSEYGNPKAAGIKIMARLRSVADEYAARGFSVTTGGRSWGNTVSGNTIYGARVAIRIGYETPSHASAPVDSAALCDCRENVITGNTAYGCMYGVSTYDEDAAQANNAAYVFNNVLRDLRLFAVDHTSDTRPAYPPYVAFKEISGVPLTGNGWGASSPVVTRTDGRNVYQRAGTPVGFVAGQANGEQSIDTATGDLYVHQGGAWKKATTT